MLTFGKNGSQNIFLNLCYVYLNQVIEVFGSRRSAPRRPGFTQQIQN